jgi:hypothetical protein
MDPSSSKMMQQCNRAASASRRARNCLWILAMFSLVIERTLGWGASGSSTDDSIYGNTFVRDWLYNSKSISLKVEGCAWGYVEDSESVGCLEDGSDDGTTNWYMMANCKRPQVVFSVYASNSGSTSCNNGNLVGSVSYHNISLDVRPWPELLLTWACSSVCHKEWTFRVHLLLANLR